MIHMGEGLGAESREGEEEEEGAGAGARMMAGEYCNPCGSLMRDGTSRRQHGKQHQQPQEAEEEDDEEEEEGEGEDEDEEKARSMLMFLLSIPYVDDAWGVHEIILDSLDNLDQE